ncbi:hypothetical protein Aca07nite_19480 [Actinoplanes capillaceus]|uniref:Uncharacterized protein n=1 Tax=Actinoplanes campanulatus TaxID=113559 RepID=A0ABQ3WGH6_9ACTN|nr:hypothetical protein [Actinoplanes capillaceus]GID44673.1 hypothetical protein Aca07nite_19480 [Actinoplanes capillaceus]
MATAPTTTPRPRATKTAPAKAAPTRAVPAANFTSKSERKRVRKSLVRAAMANYIAEKRSAHRERAEFYRRLRSMKTRRRAIAKLMFGLLVSVNVMEQQLRRVEDRNPFVGSQQSADEKLFTRLLDEAMELGRAASGSLVAASAEWDSFARRKIYFTEAVR